MKKTISFYECEHYGDLDNYVNDLQQSGAEIISYALSDEESGNVLISVPDNQFDAFLEKFKQTDSFGFSSLNP